MHVCMCMFLCMYVCMYVCMMYVCMYVCMMYVCMCICVYVCMYLCVYRYINTRLIGLECVVGMSILNIIGKYFEDSFVVRFRMRQMDSNPPKM